MFPFILHSSDHDILDDIRWFAADPNVQNPELVSDAGILRFVTDTDFTTLQATSGKNEVSRHVHDTLLAELGMEPIIFSKCCIRLGLDYRPCDGDDTEY